MTAAWRGVPSVRRHVDETPAGQTAIYDRKFEAYEALLDALDGGWSALRRMQNGLER